MWDPSIMYGHSTSIMLDPSISKINLRQIMISGSPCRGRSRKMALLPRDLVRGMSLSGTRPR